MQLNCHTDLNRNKGLFSYTNIFLLLLSFVWFLFAWSFSRIFSLIWRSRCNRWRTANFDLCSAPMAIEQWWFFNVQHLLWHGASWSSPRICDTHPKMYCRAFGSGAVTICFYDLSLSRMGFEHPTFRLRANARRCCYCCCIVVVVVVVVLLLFLLLLLLLLLYCCCCCVVVVVVVVVLVVMQYQNE